MQVTVPVLNQLKYGMESKGMKVSVNKNHAYDAEAPQNTERWPFGQVVFVVEVLVEA